MAKYIRYLHRNMTRYGELRGDSVQPLDGDFGSFSASSEAPIELTAVKLLAPTVPSKIVAIGPNFKAHFPQGGAPAEPMLWIKPPTCLGDPEGVIELPPGETINHESELALIVGKRAK